LFFWIYVSIYAAIGPAVDNETDTQQFIFPIILSINVGHLMWGSFLFYNPHGPYIAVAFSLFPLTSHCDVMRFARCQLGEEMSIWRW